MKLRAIAVLATLTSALPASSASYMDPADGKWACSNNGGVAIGTLDITGLSYAFTKPDGSEGAPGELRRVEFYDAPNFVILSGYLKDELGFVAAAVRELPVGVEHPLYLAFPDGREGSCLRPR